MKALAILAAPVVLAAAVVAVAWILNRAERAREHRIERNRHEAFLNGLQRDAIAVRDVEPYASALADDIRNHLTNTPAKRNR